MADFIKLNGTAVRTTGMYFGEFSTRVCLPALRSLRPRYPVGIQLRASGCTKRAAIRPSLCLVADTPAETPPFELSTDESSVSYSGR